MFRILNDKFCIFRTDGVLYAAWESSPALTVTKMQQIVSEAYFHTLDDSPLLRGAHECAKEILSIAPKDLAEKLRNIPDQHMYGTVTMLHDEPNKKTERIDFDSIAQSFADDARNALIGELDRTDKGVERMRSGDMSVFDGIWKNVKPQEMETKLTWHNADEELPKIGKEVFVLVWDEDCPSYLQYDLATYEGSSCYTDSKGREWSTCNDWSEGQKWFVAFWAESPEIDLRTNKQFCFTR